VAQDRSPGDRAGPRRPGCQRRHRRRDGGFGPALEDLTWLLIGAMEDGAPIFDRFAVPGEL